MSTKRRLLAILILWDAASTVYGAIPLEAFFSQPNFISPSLSPAGDKIAYIAQMGEHQIIGVRDLDDPKPALIGRNSELQYRWYWLEWANANRLLVGAETLFRSPEIMSRRRFRATRLMGINIDGSKDVILGRKWDRTGFTAIQYQDQIVDLLPDQPKHVLIEIREMDKRFSAVHRMNVNNGNLRTVEPGLPEIMDLYADGDGQVRAGDGFLDGFVARTRAEQEFEHYTIVRTGDADTHLTFAGFAAQLNIVWVYDVIDDRFVLRQFDLLEGALTGPAHGSEHYDVQRVMLDPLTDTVMGYTYVSDRTEYVFIDPDAEARYAAVLNSLPGTDHDITSVSADGSRALLASSGDTLPPQYYLYDTRSTPVRLMPVGRVYPKLAEQALASTQVVRYTTSDNWEIEGYVTTPVNSSGRNMPMVILPHGGPVARDRLRWDSEVQFFASRGYGVFRMNFRGSRGYGAAFRKPAWRQWGGRMQKDISDGVRWLIEEGIADPQRIAIVGTSYGGYAALMGGVRSPELFQAVASYAGVTHLPWLENEAGEAMSGSRNLFKHMSRDAIAEASPTQHAAGYTLPVLLGHGDLDQQVHVRHSRRMAAALQAANKDVTYLEFEDEIHGFLLQENRIKWYQALETFLQEHIGPQ